MSELIKSEHLFFEYASQEEGGQPVPVLHDINISVNSGEFVAVLGHNGSGKSTFAKHINAILQPTSGVIYVDGINTVNDELIFDIRQQVGMVFQNPDNQIVATVVEEDVAFALENLGVEPNEIRTRVDNALKQVDMYEFREHAPHQLSGGQKQRVAIAGIIAMRPKCIVLDEPTAMLDPRGRREVLKTIKELNEKYKTTVVFITHFMDEAVQAHRIIVIDNGKVLLDDTPEFVFSHVSLLKEVGLDVPQVTELAYELKKYGVNLSDSTLHVDDCVNQLVEILGD
ncbi:energy-coupling factor transporter ATPase [Paludicola sp. MB14-C6]|uniref:energy-coupling factor transporter ATPase n=1 Tax=Paludihabitans sp. MB14-C6 TaxID=3070656 RepID=UPI0027DD75AB|nr:energy-coupling factor transporter ATPase [Paludicola sp. MB14-C6]WMJ23295.1 energy-coupling factor transporter ATPase [Paludicola sp. MB14-C6]